MKEYASGNVTKQEVQDDFQKMDIPVEYVEYISSKIDSSNEFIKKSIRERKTLRKYNWRY